jgi:hypothetical protein
MGALTAREFPNIVRIQSGCVMKNPAAPRASSGFRAFVAGTSHAWLPSERRDKAMSDVDEKFMWQMIELAWTKAEASYAEGAHGAPKGQGSLRASILAGPPFDYDYDVALRPFCWALDDILGDVVTMDGLLSFARAFETKLFELDREDLCAHIGLGDDGFLDARGFIIAMGEEYCQRVLRHRRAALRAASVEQAYMAVIRAFESRCRQAYPRFGFRVTTGSNLDGWPSRRKVEDLAARMERMRQNLLALVAADRAPSHGGAVVVSLDAEQRAYLESLLASRRAPAPGEGG